MATSTHNYIKYRAISVIKVTSKVPVPTITMNPQARGAVGLPCQRRANGMDNATDIPRLTRKAATKIAEISAWCLWTVIAPDMAPRANRTETDEIPASVLT